MSDIFIVWDSRLFLENFLKESVLSVLTVNPNLISAPHLKKPKMIIIPSGFGNPEYSKVSEIIIKKKSFFKNYLNEGGILFFFSPLFDNYDFSQFGIDLIYIKKDIKVPLDSKLVTTSEGISFDCLPDKSEKNKNENGNKNQLLMYCDGYFAKKEDKNEINKIKILKEQNGQALFIYKKEGNGHIFCASFHELPNPDLFKNIIQKYN